MNPSRKVILIAKETESGGHIASFCQAWTDFFRSNQIRFDIKKIRSSNKGFLSPRVRWAAFCSDLIYTIKFWIDIWREDDKTHIYLFLDSPCSYPFGIRLVLALVLRFGLNKKSFMVCHAYPRGGDEKPGINDDAASFHKYFHSRSVFVHSANLHEYLNHHVGIDVSKLQKFSWGCNPVRRSLFRESKRLRLLFIGQYRSSKGLEWFWNELQLFKHSCDVRVVISTKDEIGQQVRIELEKSKKNNIHSLEFHHALYFKDEALDAYFQDVDLVVIPYFSTHSLVSGLVFLAAEHGCPVISSRHSESGSIPESQGFGFSFPPISGREMRAQLDKYATLSKNQKLSMRENALKFAEQHSWNQVLGEVWQKMLKQLDPPKVDRK